MGTDIMMVLLLVLAFVFGFGACTYFLPKYLNRKDSQRLKSTEKMVERLLKRLNCTYTLTKEESGVRYYEYDFQGGHFRLKYTAGKPFQQLQYFFLCHVPERKFSAARILCNRLNRDMSVGKFFYSYSEKTHSLDIHLSYGISLLDDNEGNSNFLKMLMEDSFQMQRVYLDILSSVRNDSPGYDVEGESFGWRRELFLLREQEFFHQKENLKFRPNATENLCLRDLLYKVFDLSEIHFRRLSVATDHLTIETDAQKISEFDLLSPVLTVDEGKVSWLAKQATLTVSFTRPAAEVAEEQCVTLTMQAEGEHDKAAYIRLTACLTPLNASRIVSLGTEENVAHAISFLIACDKASDDQHVKEFEYMWQDAQDRMKGAKMSELSPEQALICSCIRADISCDLYWGVRFFSDKRFYEALLYLENAYGVLKSDYQVLGESARSKFMEICYYIGFCYAELHQYERACYFLEISFHANRILWTMEYVNCLVNSKDFRALSLIDYLLNGLKQYMAESENALDDNLHDFMNFLRRRKAFVLIDLGRYEEAEQMFTAMLNERDNSDYALSELAYIQRLKKEKGKS